MSIDSRKAEFGRLMGLDSFEAAKNSFEYVGEDYTYILQQHDKYDARVEQLEQELAKVTKERDEWMAHCERLRDGFKEAGGEQYEVYSETPAASLAEIQAKAIEGEASYLSDSYPSNYYAIYISNEMNLRAHNLRQQAGVKG